MYVVNLIGKMLRLLLPPHSNATDETICLVEKSSFTSLNWKISLEIWCTHIAICLFRKISQNRLTRKVRYCDLFVWKM